ncbi:hypothetical protein LJ739_07845 [Aestuariibacter halophilus]|uniref:Thiazolylpeptide-type bacteriocin n=1 Tax=Fluctibacter halophilus TaxID=226011 RepID=A0ABS8G6J7_9ALTE|nr:hypothetical protein [Aestuariibacter halophilus]MCC2616148.1 hypothetical protein [Aestuariibacter halophilus]
MKNEQNNQLNQTQESVDLDLFADELDDRMNAAAVAGTVSSSTCISSASCGGTSSASCACSFSCLCSASIAAN